MLLGRRKILQIGLTAGSLASFSGRNAWAGPRSGLPWVSGVSSWKPDAFIEWRGRPLDVITVFSRFNTWQQMQNLARPGTLLGKMAKRPERLSISLAMFPRRDGPVPRDDPSLWAEAANGAYDPYWEKGLKTLRRRLARLDPIMRVGWEWNGSSYPWRIVEPRYAEGYRNTFRRLGGIIKFIFPEAEIDWCSLKHGETLDTIDVFYPGDDIVDYIGHDRYDRNPSPVSLPEWQEAVEAVEPTGGPRGLNAWLHYAKSKGKRLSIPEWGVWSAADRGGGAGDNAFFVEQMFDFFERNAADIGYECYFNQEGGEAKHTLGPDGFNPEASEAYRRLYAAT